MKKLFHGACTALVTPFRDGYINYCMLDRLLELQLEAGIDAMVICGTTGESATLTDEEKLALYRHTANRVGGACQLIAGTGGNCTKKAAELTRAACDTGVDAVLSVTPYYNKCTQDGLLRHYTEIAEASSLPVILYNVPSRTTVSIEVATCAKLAEHPNIQGIKEADPNAVKVLKLREACGEEFRIYCGNDDCTLSFYASGADGVISVYSNLYPNQTKKLTDFCEQGAYKKAAALLCTCLPLMDALFCVPNPMPVKAALQMMGIDVGNCRLPLTEPSQAQKAMLKALL